MGRARLIRNGIHTIFTLQHRVIARSPWLKPKEPVIDEKSEDWFFCGEQFARSLNPHIGTGNDWRAANKKAECQWYDTQRATGVHGWYDANYAIKAIKRVRDDDDKGMYDTVSTYGQREQVVRHEFRIVQVVVNYQFSIHPMNCTREMINSLAG